MDCPKIPEIGYKEFSDSIFSKVATDRIPISGSIELTMRCNLKCYHCYCVYNKDKKELSTSQWKNIIDQIVDAGCLWLLLTGGDPLIRSDFIEIYLYAKRKGLIITIFTNGTLLTPQIADFLKDYPPFSVEITLYGATNKTYEKVTRITDSFDSCIKGIDLLLQRNVPLKLKTTITTLNKDELWEIKEYSKKLGIEFRFDLAINPKMNGSMESCQYRLCSEEVVKLDLADNERREKWEEYYQRTQKQARPDKLYFCGAGQDMFHIDSYGNLSICIMSRRSSYNVEKKSFLEGWHNFLPKINSQKRKIDYKCAQCEIWFLCEHCPGWAELEEQDSQMHIDYLCQIAQQRAEYLKKEEVI